MTDAPDSSSEQRLKAKQHKNLGIQGLRGVLSFSLYLFHVANSGLPTFSGTMAAIVEYIGLSLTHGVELFFGISGVVIVGAYRRHPDAVLFLKNRAIRIFPVLWPAIFVILAMAPLAGKGYDYGSFVGLMMTTLANMLAMPPLVPAHLIHPAAWSLSYEFAFYLLCVLVGMGEVRGRRYRLALAILLGLLLIGTHVRSLMFVGGVAIMLWAPKLERVGLAFDYPLPLMIAAPLLWHTGFLMLGSVSEVTIIALLAVPAAAGCFVLATVCGFCALGGIFFGRGWVSVLLRTRPVQWLGDISYSLYLWQAVTMAVVKKVLLASGFVAHLGSWSQVAFLLLALPPTLILSRLSYLYLEVRLPRALAHLSLGGGGAVVSARPVSGE